MSPLGFLQNMIALAVAVFLILTEHPWFAGILFFCLLLVPGGEGEK